MPAPDAAANARYTWDDFIALDDDDRRELIDGELVEVEVPTVDHERVVLRLGYYLVGWTDVHGGIALASGYKLRVSDRRGVMPDLQLLRAGNDAASQQQQGLVSGRADLVVEIISPSSRRFDRLKKLNWYAQLGVPEYWIVDPEGQTLEQLVLRDGAYAIVSSFEGTEGAFQPTTFEGLVIPLARLWSA
jgi:Uma2 family endonuclease